MSEGLYLLHLASPMGHASHYLGWARKREERIKAHLDGRGSAFTRAMCKAGIGVTWVQLMEGTKTDERRLKNAGTLKKVCLLCLPERRERERLRMRALRERRRRDQEREDGERARAS